MDVTKDRRTWRLGNASDVAWIAHQTTRGPSITAAIPPIFENYATIYEPEDVTTVAHERALVQRLTDHTTDQPWWLGFLDTGAHDVVIAHAPRISLYWDWGYVLVQAGPEQALSWRTGHMRAQFGVLPDLFFPADHSWLVSALWDDTWTCIGGPADLIDVLQQDRLVNARRVQPAQDATPPGHTRD